MKRLLCFFSFILGLSLPFTVSAQEIIHDFSVSAVLQAPHTLRIVERITYDFGPTPRHGIIRTIPTTYERQGATFKLHLNHIQVFMDEHAVAWTASESGGKTTLKIGDSASTITGSHVFSIQYETDRAINFFDDHSELYWNVTGNEWEVPIESASFDYSAAGEIPITKSDCFVGPFGSTERSCDIVARGARISTTRLLLPEEGLTVAIAFSLSALTPPSRLEQIAMILRDNGILAIPLLIGLIMFGLWWKLGRDPKLSTIIPIYEPPERLNPGELSAIVDEGGLPTRGLTAMIIKLAKDGYLHIQYGEETGIFQKKQTFTLIRTSRPAHNLHETDTILLNGLFSQTNEISIADLQKQQFYTHVASIKTALWKHIQALDLFVARPSMIRGTYTAIAAIICWVLLAFFSRSPLGTIVAIMSGAIIAVGGWFMPRRTQKGTALLAEIKGFEWFLRVTEKDRLAFHNAPERTPEQFQELLPYAIALGVEKEWAKQFEHINLTQPEWLDGTTGSSFNSLMFVSTLENFHSQAAASSYSAPSSAGSGGSGFSGGGSGGGGGGGGGGSW